MSVTLRNLPPFEFMKVDEHATFDHPATSHSIGIDLTCVGVELKKDGRIMLDLGVRTQSKDNNVGFLLIVRSSFSKFNLNGIGFYQANPPGLIDPDYRGNWFLCLRSTAENPLTLTEPELRELFLYKKVAQAVPVEAFSYQMQEVTEITETERGEGGFGSTDQK